MIAFVEIAPKQTEDLRKRATRDLAANRLTRPQWDAICRSLNQLDALVAQIIDREEHNGDS